jgi:hypothetical protein
MSVERLARFDAFFHPTLVEPGRAISPFSQDFFGEHIIDSESEYIPLVSPRCEVTVRWVQFADGTTFGDNSYARPLLENRATTLKVLQQLNEVYVNEGSEKFAEQLQQRVNPPTADSYLDHIRTLQKRRGTARAVEALQTHLSIAQERAILNVVAP